LYAPAGAPIGNLNTWWTLDRTQPGCSQNIIIPFSHWHWLIKFKFLDVVTVTVNLPQIEMQAFLSVLAIAVWTRKEAQWVGAAGRSHWQALML
jgi:hypothetical protein